MNHSYLDLRGLLLRTAQRWLWFFAVAIATLGHPNSAKATTDGVWSGYAYPIFQYRIFAAPGVQYSVATSNLDWAGADPIALAISLGAGPVDWNHHGGTIIGVNDDSAPGNPNSRLVFSVGGTAQWVKVVVMSATNGAEGSATITIRDLTNGVVLEERHQAMFGGFHVNSRTTGGNPIAITTPSHIFAGLSASYTSGVADLDLHVFKQDLLGCISGGCGPYNYNDDSCGILPRIFDVLNQGPVYDAWIAVGLRATVGRTPVSTFLSNALDDEDGDLLSWQLESMLNTCDSELGPGTATPDGSKWVGVPGMGCREYSEWLSDATTFPSPPYFEPPDIGTWHAVDSDNDGIGDLEEVWCAERCFNKNPVPPFDNPGQCLPGDSGRCAAPCPSPAPAFRAPFILNSLPSKPRPTQFDVYYSLFTPMLSDGTVPHDISAQKRAATQYFFQQEGLECALCPSGQAGCNPPGSCCTAPSDCPLDPRYRINLHLIDEPSIEIPDDRHELLAHTVHPGEVTFVQMLTGSYWRRAFSPHRKYSSLFRFLYSGTNLNEGRQSSNGGIISGSSQPVDYGARGVYLASKTEPGMAAHEIGHNLGLSHSGGTNGGTNNSVLYESLMIYGNTSAARTISFSSLGDSCSYLAPCPTGLRCSSPPGAICIPDCRAPRFSRGPLGSVTSYTEAPSAWNTLGEAGIPGYIAATALCRIFDPAEVATLVKDGYVSCSGSSCFIDFNKNGLPDSGGDSNFNGVISSGEYEGFNDWAAMLRTGHVPLGYFPGRPDVAVMLLTFAEGRVFDMAMWAPEQSIVVTPGVFVGNSTDPNHTWSNYEGTSTKSVASFSASGNPEYIQVPGSLATWALDPVVGPNLEAHPVPLGLTVRVRFRLDDCPPFNQPHIVESGMYRIFAECNGAGAASLRFETRGWNPAAHTSSAVPIVLGKWYLARISIEIESGSSLITARDVRYWLESEGGEVEHCEVNTLQRSTAVRTEHGATVLGNGRQPSVTLQFIGELDDVLVTSEVKGDLPAEQEDIPVCP